MALDTWTIILTYNGEGWIAKCLDSLLAAGVNAGQLVIIDNDSKDQTAQLIQDTYPGVQVKVNRQNLGFGSGCNVGIRMALEAGAEFIMLLNQDTTVEADCFTALEGAVSERGAEGVFAPLQLTYDGAGIDPGMRKGILGEAGEFVDDLWRRSMRATYRLPGAYGGAVMFHRRIFEVVGLFDENFFLYGEDEDLFRRIRRAGFPVWLVTASLVRHWHTLEHVEKDLSHGIQPHVRRSRLILALKDLDRIWTGRCLYALRALAGQCVNALVRLDKRGFANGILDGIWLMRNLRRIKRARELDQRILPVLVGTEARVPFMGPPYSENAEVPRR